MASNAHTQDDSDSESLSDDDQSDQSTDELWETLLSDFRVITYEGYDPALDQNEQQFKQIQSMIKIEHGEPSGLHNSENSRQQHTPQSESVACSDSGYKTGDMGTISPLQSIDSNCQKELLQNDLNIHIKEEQEDVIEEIHHQDQHQHGQGEVTQDKMPSPNDKLITKPVNESRITITTPQIQLTDIKHRYPDILKTRVNVPECVVDTGSDITAIDSINGDRRIDEPEDKYDSTEEDTNLTIAACDDVDIPKTIENPQSPQTSQAETKNYDDIMKLYDLLFTIDDGMDCFVNLKRLSSRDVEVGVNAVVDNNSDCSVVDPSDDVSESRPPCSKTSPVKSVITDSDNETQFKTITENGTKFHVCQICEYSSKDLRTLKQHIISRHSSLKPHACHLCQFTTKLTMRLNQHIKRMHSKWTHVCKHCNKKFFNGSLLRKHMSIHTGEKNYECKTCGKKFRLHQGLKIHQASHSAVRPFSCTQCDYRAKTKSNLRKHEIIHTECRRYKCSMCDYTCTYPSILSEHVNRHTGTRPFACKYCDYRAVTKDRLIQHEHKHTGERPRKCRYCDYTCATYVTLKYHINSYHTALKPHKCKLCLYRASQLSHIKTHMMTHSQGSNYLLGGR